MTISLHRRALALGATGLAAAAAGQARAQQAALTIATGGSVTSLDPHYFNAAPNSALIIRLTRSSMLDVARADYVKTAWAKGLSEGAVTTRHIFRNSLISVVSALGFTFVALLAGTVVTETVFSLPGVGRLVVESLLRRDYPTIQGVILIVAFVYMLVNLLVDLSFAILDPRIRYS